MAWCGWWVDESGVCRRGEGIIYLHAGVSLIVIDVGGMAGGSGPNSAADTLVSGAGEPRELLGIIAFTQLSSVGGGLHSCLFH